MKKITKEQLFQILEDCAKEDNSRWETPEDVETYYIEVEKFADMILVRPMFNDSFHSAEVYIKIAESLGFRTFISVDKNKNGVNSPTLNFF